MKRKYISILILLASVILIIVLVFLGWKVIKERTKPKISLPDAQKNSRPVVNLGPYSGKANEARKEILAKVTKSVGDEIIYTADGVKVVYLVKSDIFTVAILKGPFEEKKKLVEDWFKSFGLTSADLCRFGIEFAVSKDVKFPLSSVDMAPTGCREEAQ